MQSPAGSIGIPRRAFPSPCPQAPTRSRQPSWSRRKWTNWPAICPMALPYSYASDTTDFIKLSVEEVSKALIEAIVLVVLVMFLFLQSWRATLIPAIAVPVVLLGTFVVFLHRRILGQHTHALRFGSGDRTACRRCDRGGGERRTGDGRKSRHERAGCHHPVDAGNPGRAGGDRAGPVRGFPAHGLLRRIDRRDLSPVLAHDHLGDGAFGAGRLDPEPRADRHFAQAQRRTA